MTLPKTGPRTTDKTASHPLRTSLARVFVDPIKHGALQPRTWPGWVQVCLGVTTLSFLVCIAYLLSAEPLRTSGELVTTATGSYLPLATIPVLSFLCFWALTLLQTAALGLHWALRALALIGLLPVFGLQLYQYEPLWGLCPVIGWLGLLVVNLLARGSFKIWYFPAVAACVFVGFQLPVVGSLGVVEAGYDPRGLTLSTQINVLAILAAPTLIVAGAALTQVTARAGAEAGRLAVGIGRPIALALLGVGLVWRGWLSIIAWWDETASLQMPVLFTAGAVLVLSAVLASPFIILGIRSNSGVPKTINSLVERFSWLSFAVVLPTSVWLLLVTTWSLIKTPLEVVLDWQPPKWADAAFSLNQLGISMQLGFVVGAVVGLGLSWRWARRGNWLPSLFLASLSIQQVWQLVAYLASDGGTQLIIKGWALTAWLWVATIVVALWLMARRRLQGPALHLVIAATATMLLFEVRELIAEPLVAVVGFTATGALLMGLIWRALTDGEFTTGDSPGLPRIARVLLYLASITLAGLALVYGATSRDVSALTDLASWEEIGDSELAVPLYVACVALLLGQALQAATTTKPIAPGLGHPASRVPSS